MAARRITTQGLARGWTTWQEAYFNQKRTEQLLRGAGARMGKPQLVKCFGVWFSEWEAAERAQSVEGRLALAHEEAERARAEVAKAQAASSAYVAAFEKEREAARAKEA